MRLLLVGAFPYPQNHGSQIYFQEQAIGLRSLGADVTLLTYGSGKPLASNDTPRDTVDRARQNRSKDHQTRAFGVAEHWRALDGFEHLVSPSWTAPSSLRSGPSWAKPLADFGLAMTLRNAIASFSSHKRFDAILTHNAEATLATLLALPRRRPPVVYCAHTLLAKELSAYLKVEKVLDFAQNSSKPSAKRWTAAGLDRFGRWLDQTLARRCDGFISLTQSSYCVMRHFSDAPGELIPPALPDPELEPRKLDPVAAVRRHGLEPGRFLLYSGNLDAYQEIDILEAAARRRAGGDRGRELRIVIASHSERSAAQETEAEPAVGFLRVDSSAEMQALLAAARGTLVMRRAEGGFPIKLVNSLAAGTPAIAFHGPEWGLEHERDSLICAPTQPVESLVAAIDRLERDEDLASGLSTGARALYLQRHRPRPAAKRVLALVEEVCRSVSGR